MRLVLGLATIIGLLALPTLAASPQVSVDEAAEAAGVFDEVEEQGTEPQAGAYSDYVPTLNGYIATATEAPPDTDLVKRLFILGHMEECEWAMSGGLGGIEPDIYDLPFRDPYQEPDEPERLLRLYQFTCNGGAYNFQSVFLRWDQYGGVKLLTFAVPSYEVTYADTGKGEDEMPEDQVLDHITVTGMTTQNALTNPTFDPETRTLTSVGYWRGIGDASSTGTWVQRGEDFALQSYDIDPTYDGEVNPIRVFDRSTPEIFTAPAP